MTRRVVAVREGATFKEIAARLRDEHVSAFPVINEDNKVIGVVSAADLLAREAVAGDYQNFTGPLAGLLHRQELEKAQGVTAGELMTWPPVTVGPGDPVSQAAQLMYDRRVKRLPVVDAVGRLAGIVSRTDILSVFSRPDDEILKQITNDVILDTYLKDPDRFRVTVKDGVVTMSGDPESAMAGREIIDTIRHVEGVVAVRDRLDHPADEPVHTYGPLF
jgi:CBS domain-containing protein